MNKNVMSYSDCEKEVGERPQILLNKFEWFGYKNGEVKIFDTEKEAKEWAYTVERFVSNKDEVIQNRKDLADYDTKVHAIWWNSVRSCYSHLPDKVFDILYDEAYDRGHSAGYDEVASYLIDYNNLYARLKKAEKE